MRMTKIIAAILKVGTAVVLSASLMVACLSTTDEDFTGEFGGAGDLTLHNFPNFNSYISDDDDDYYTDDDDDYYMGAYCEAVADCVCAKLSSSSYDKCVTIAEGMSESECETLINDSYPGCDPYY